MFIPLWLVVGFWLERCDTRLQRENLKRHAFRWWEIAIWLVVTPALWLIFYQLWPSHDH